jgi:protein SCO1/2
MAMTRADAESTVILLFSVVLLGAISIGVYAGDGMHDMDRGMHMDMSGGADAHAHHHMAQKVSVTTADYSVPQIRLVREDNQSVSLPDEMNDGRPVILNFIYTTCTAVCPITSRTFAQLQDKLGDERNKVHMISITIDPEQDTPARLADYAHKFDAGPQWRFYTGTSEASLAAQRAFDVYRGDKMNHAPVTLLRAAPGKSWLRIDGFASADMLMQEYRNLVATK